ncbi:hypothetical protein PG984_005647 [Apiospora sp. TS-2023a]
MSVYVHYTNELSAESEARRSAVRALLEEHDPNLRQDVAYKQLEDVAVSAVQDELLNASRPALIAQVRMNNLNADWYHWRIDRAMFNRVLNDQEFPYEDDAPKSLPAPHSSEWSSFWVRQVDDFAAVLKETVVDEHCAEPIAVEASGIATNVGDEHDVGDEHAGATPAVDERLPMLAQPPINPRQVAWTCANCGENGHTLGDCIIPKAGDRDTGDYHDIAGCPLCNTKHHLFDECHNTKYLGAEAVLNILYFRRSGKCQIRTNREIYFLFKQYVEQLQSYGADPADMLKVAAPWTRAFTRQFVHDPEYADKVKGYDYRAKNLQPLATDSTVAIGEIMEGKVSSGYKTYRENKIAAAYKSHVDRKGALEGFRVMSLQNSAGAPSFVGAPSFSGTPGPSGAPSFSGV